MAQSTQKTTEIEELVRLSELSRAQLGQAHARLRRTLDAPSRFRESVRSQPGKWLGGSAAIGLATSFLFKRKRKPKENLKSIKKQRGLLLGMLGLAFTLVKPVAKVYATKLVKDYLKNQFREGSLGRLTLAKPSQY